MKKKRIKDTARSNGNAFADLGRKDAENLKLRAELMVEIRRYIEKNGLTQAEAAKRMGTTQTRLNEILRG